MTDETTASDSDDSIEPSHDSVDASTFDDQAIESTDDVEPADPDEFGLVQVWWGDGKGKTTAALGMGFRAAGHGYRVHLLQFMKGGADSVEDVRGEYAAIDEMATFTYETTGEYGWHGFSDGTDDDEHAARAQAALARAREVASATGEGDATDDESDESPHMLILDEVLYAANRDLVDPDDVREFVESKPPHLELVLTGGHERPEYVTDLADLVTHVEKEAHPIEDGQGARKGTEY